MIQKWEVLVTENNLGKYKVTRRWPKLFIAETKTLESKEEVKKQFEDWLR